MMEKYAQTKSNGFRQGKKDAVPIDVKTRMNMPVGNPRLYNM